MAVGKEKPRSKSKGSSTTKAIISRNSAETAAILWQVKWLYSGKEIVARVQVVRVPLGDASDEL